MISVERVIRVEYCGYPHNCLAIRYLTEGDILAYAAVAEHLSVEEGDLVWVLHNDRLNYKDFNSVAVLHV